MSQPDVLILYFLNKCTIFRYYYNKKTKQSSWDKPLELMTPTEVSQNVIINLSIPLSLNCLDASFL